MSDIKKWKEFLLWLWSNYGKNNIYLSDVRKKRGSKGVSWLGAFWRWGLLRRVAAGSGIYTWSVKGLNKVEYYTKEAKKKSWNLLDFTDDE